MAHGMWWRTAIVIAATGILAMGASAQQGGRQRGEAGKRVDLGKVEFESRCASCHGMRGKGDGPVKAWLTKSPPDLTTLAKRNGGILPANEIYEVIEGKKAASVHGTRDMPVWGAAFRNEAAEYFIEAPYDPEAYVRARILTLVEYINRLQAK